VDIGQIEGGLVQGLGWMTMEEIVYNDKGKLLSNALSTYKVPGHPQRTERRSRSRRFRPTATRWPSAAARPWASRR
jgi:xanthine dehydrogenase molybdopterin-binding subunit B